MTSPLSALPPACRTWIAVLLLGLCAMPAVATETIPLQTLPPAARLALWGDSITEQRIYSVYVEAYLLACAGRPDVAVCTFGHDGETLAALLSRQVDLAAFRPTVVAFNYGMNDARDAIPWSDEHGERYRKTLDEVLAMLAARGLQALIVGPGHATAPSRSRPADAAAAEHLRQRNIALGHFRDLGLAAARRTGLPYADINRRMAETLELGGRTEPGYSFVDIHAAPNGHLAMACELLRALGCDGAIADITLDLHAGARASAGHTVTDWSDGVALIDSSRYPFCCEYDPAAHAREGSLASVLPYLPFQQELNRFTLRVVNLDAPGAEVGWGGAARHFTREQLAAGINLAAEFPCTPFDTSFARLIAAIADKQRFELFMIKGTSNFFGNDAGGNVDAGMVAVHERLDAALKALATPVRHAIAIVADGSSGGRPAIGGARVAFGAVGVPFDLTLTALRGPVAFSATGLPPGLVIDSASGRISGVPSAAGSVTATVTATSAAGSTSIALAFTVAGPLPAMPAIADSAPARCAAGAPFSQRIAASNEPTAYFAWMIGIAGNPPGTSSLPAGLTCDIRTGILSGIPTAAGTYSISVAAVNAGGIGTGKVVIEVTAGGK